MAQANGILIFRPWVKASAFAKGAENLVVLARAGAGYDKIDVAACTENDVAPFNAPDTLTHSTVSAAFTLMIALAKKLPQQENLVRTGRWDRQSEFLGDDLIGKTLGIIGLGKTGVGIGPAGGSLPHEPAGLLAQCRSASGGRPWEWNWWTSILCCAPATS